METMLLQRRQVVHLAVSRDAGAVLATSLYLWQCLARELSAIIGEGGFHSMYARSLHLSSTRFAFLPLANLGNTDPAQQQPELPADEIAPGIKRDQAGQFALLIAALATQPLQQASLASIDLLCTFIDLLALLIGEHLTSTILRSAWGDTLLSAKEHHE